MSTAKYPLGERPDKMLRRLRSRGRDDKPQGVHSHETALSLHELSDINPAKLHMTVPPDFAYYKRVSQGLRPKS